MPWSRQAGRQAGKQADAQPVMKQPGMLCAFLLLGKYLL